MVLFLYCLKCLRDGNGDLLNVKFRNGAVALDYLIHLTFLLSPAVAFPIVGRALL